MMAESACTKFSIFNIQLDLLNFMPQFNIKAEFAIVRIIIMDVLHPWKTILMADSAIM